MLPLARSTQAPPWCLIPSGLQIQTYLLGLGVPPPPRPAAIERAGLPPLAGMALHSGRPARCHVDALASCVAPATTSLAPADLVECSWAFVSVNVLTLDERQAGSSRGIATQVPFRASVFKAQFRDANAIFLACRRSGRFRQG